MAPTPPYKRVQVKVEVGHHATCRENIMPNGYTHDWTIFVRGAEGADISHFVEKVVFILHESFPKPRRVIKAPPYEVTECGYGSFTLPVEIYFRNNKEEPRKYRLEYDLSLQLVGMPALNITKVDSLTFLNPSEDFEKKLSKGGATILGALSSPTPNQMTSKQDPLSKASPASSHGSSPGSVKKSQLVSKQVKPKENLNHTPTQMNSSVQSIKRPITEESLQKAKKKKLEKVELSNNSSVSNSTPKPMKEISVLSPGTDAQDPLKVKSLANTKKIKDRRKSAETVPNNTESPKHIHNKEVKSKGKEIKIKKEKKKSPDVNEEKPKLQKFTIKRLDDAWSSINTPVTTNHNNNLISRDVSKDVISNNMSLTTETILVNPMTTSTKQNERVSKLFAEFAEDSSSEDDIGIAARKASEENKTNTHSPLVVNNYNNNNNTPTTVQTDLSKQKKLKTPKHGLIPNGKSPGNVKKEQLQKKTPRPTDAGKTLPNGNMNGSIPHVKPTPMTHHNKNLESTSLNLQEIYEKLNNSDDGDLLQKVVDIVGDTGFFEITAATFDFDLCILNDETISRIKTCLEIS